MSILSLCHPHYNFIVLLLFRYKSFISDVVIRPSFIDYYLGRHHFGYCSTALQLTTGGTTIFGKKKNERKESQARKIILPSPIKTKGFGEKSSSESIRTESMKLHKHYEHLNSETFAC